ncbi:MAG: hypothetical protein HN522_05235 [Flavobacteriales bacterium]|jgi:hypothetical protein|nr:hypothetical protein [Flavobacteriales bacterium]MBT5089859.1 hypothetical protein [Flavobacteriales bacterium]MBT5749731.1 hypothetical protein [Flavobacteriales bacterium]
MKAKQIALILIPLNIILAYFVYNSINSEVEFQQVAKVRIAENVQKLKDLRQVQIAYKKVNNTYSNNFESLIDFLKNDSMAIVKAIGETPDTLTDSQALKLGIISRDTAYVLTKETVFNEAYLTSRNKKFPLDLSVLTNVPHSNENYSIDAGMIEKGKVLVQVFEISTTYGAVFTGLDAKNKSFELDNLLKVGSMDEASLNGNWGE